MRRGRIFIFLALILIIGLAAAAFVFRQVLIPTPPPVVQQVPTVQIYIAGQNIAQGQRITDDVITTINFPQENLVSVMYTIDQRSELVDRVAKYPIDQGVVITRTMVSDGAVAISGPAWASQIPQGMTALAVPTSRLDSAAYGIQDGAHVDVTACFLFIDVDPAYQTQLPNNVGGLIAPGTAAEGQVPSLTLSLVGNQGIQGRTEVETAFQQGIYVVPSEGQRPRLVCQMIAQNAIVLKLGSFDLPTPPPTEQNPEAAPQPLIPDIVTLVVNPQDAVTMSYLVYSGAKITMTLRNVLDESRVATEAATLQFLLSQYNIPVPAKLPYASQPRIDSLP